MGDTRAAPRGEERAENQEIVLAKGADQVPGAAPRPHAPPHLPRPHRALPALVVPPAPSTTPRCLGNALAWTGLAWGSGQKGGLKTKVGASCVKVWKHQAPHTKTPPDNRMAFFLN